VRGALITLEGIDGTGKSTIVRILAEHLKDRDVVLTAEPTKGDVGAILRKRLNEPALETTGPKLFEELFLFMADHADHLSRVVMPSLERGAIVISDRYSDSTVAYQGATLKGAIPDPISWIRSIHYPWNVVPDLTLLFALDPEIAIKRIAARDSSVAKFEREDFLRQVEENFMAMARLEPQRFVLINASEEIDSVAEKAMTEVSRLLDAKSNRK
jgi:dTMP kinase